jgi:predicted nucleotidyltransferase
MEITCTDLDPTILPKIVERIRRVANPRRIVLFGSRARGDHRPDSDIDLLVIEDSPLPRHRRAIPLYAALSDLHLDVDAEVIVYTPAEVENWRGASAAFVTTALREGKVLYEADQFVQDRIPKSPT